MIHLATQAITYSAPIGQPNVTDRNDNATRHIIIILYMFTFYCYSYFKVFIGVGKNVLKASVFLKPINLSAAKL